MKIRNGFVSNSSTSSFIVIGHKFKSEEITKFFTEDEEDVYDALESIEYIGYVADSEVDAYYIGEVISDSGEDILEDSETEIGDLEQLKSIKAMRETFKYEGPLKIYSGTRAC